MSRNRYGRKVKRTHSLYRRRKSTLRKALEAVGTVVLIGGLGFLGYAAAPPVIDFFKNGMGAAETGSLEWKPEDITTTEDAALTTAPSEDTTTTAEPAAEEPAAFNAALAPDTALDSSAALAAFMNSAKKSGYNYVVLEMKNSSGYVRYKSNLDRIKDTDVVTGTMTLAEINAISDSADMKIIARMSTVKDSVGPKVITDGAVRFADDSYAWLDGRVENGGKQWLDPFREPTSAYLNSIVTELCRAGITDIILENTYFPEYNNYDVTILDTAFFANDRYKALSALITGAEDSAEKSGGKVYARASLSDLLMSYGGYTGTAEFIADTGFPADIPVVLEFSKSDFGAELKTGDSSSVKLPSEAGQLVKTLYTQAKRYTRNLEIIPLINSKGFSAKEIESIKSVLAELKYENYMIS